MDTKTEMVTFDQAIELKGRKAIEFFSKKDNLTPLVEFVKEGALSIVPDVNTKKGRDAIGSTARKVSQARKALTDAIDSSVSDMEAKVKVAKQSSKYVKEELNQTRAQILAPRDTWQAEQDLIEETRIADIKAEIDKILAIGTLQGNESKDEIASLVEAVETIDVSEGFEEFTVDAAKAIQDVLKTLNDKVLSIIETEQKAEINRQLETERKANKISERLNKLATIPMALIGKSSSKIKAKIDSLNKYVIPEDEFGDSYPQAVASVKKVIRQLTSMHDERIIVEDQTKEDTPAPQTGYNIGASSPDYHSPSISKPSTPDKPVTQTPTDPVIEETVTISKAEYQQLLSDSEFLGCLCNAGVDGWDGYDQAQSMMHDKI